jgi:Ser/Thr protein kinase RdoA (MazF antagonist)
VRVTLRRDGAAGRPVAYLKHLPDRGGERLLTLYGALASRAGAAGGPRLGQALGYDQDSELLWLAPVAGVPVDDSDGMRAFGQALAGLHGLPPAPLPRFERLRPCRVAAAAAIVAAARPDVAERAAALAGALRATPLPAEHDAVLHGDAHPKNCLVEAGGATLIDLDQAALGPASADLGGVLARLVRDRLAGRLDAAEAAARREGFLDGYARVRPLPPAAALAWHQAAALLVESALRAVNRVYDDALAVLDDLLAAGLACLEGSRA